MKKILSTLLMLIAVFANIKATAGDKEPHTNPVLVSHTNTLKISKDKLKADPVLSMPDAKYKVSGFEIAYLPKGSNDVQGPYMVKGDRFDIKQLSAILANAKPGDKIYFNDVKATSSNASDPELTLAAAVLIE